MTEDSETEEGDPQVSPDGQQISWTSIVSDDSIDLYVSLLDGTERTRLTQASRNFSADWQPCTSE